MEQKPARLGHALSVIAMGVSWTLSVNGAWEAQVGWTCALFITMACLTEPSKIKANQILWAPKALWYDRLIAVLWYLACIGLSVYLLHMPAEVAKHKAEAKVEAARAARTADQAQAKLALQEAQRAAQDAAQAVKRIEDDLGVTKDKLQPGAPSLAAARARMSDRLSTQERKVAELDLQAAIENDKLYAKVTRLTGELTAAKTRFELETRKFDNLKTQSIEPMGEISIDASMHRSTDSIYIFAFVLEVTISLGIWADGVYNRGIPMPAGDGGVVTSLFAHRSRVDRAAEQPANDENPAFTDFETWLQHEWHSKKNDDGWLITTQRRMQEGSRASSTGAVHGFLSRLIDRGRIEKKVVGRKTYIRFATATVVTLRQR